MRITETGFRRERVNSELNFHGEDVPAGIPEEAFFYFIPVPLEQSVSYGGGTARGPEAILQASGQLELLENQVLPGDRGIYTAPALDCRKAVEDVLARIESEVSHALECEALPIMLGGEHTVSLGAVRALQKRYGSDFAVVQFDAHADLRHSYTGTTYSHASVMRRIHELGVPLYQLGTRSYSLEEDAYRRSNGVWYRDAEDIWREGVDIISLPAECPENIYLSFDVDAWDTSLMPATGTPVPGGLDWYQSVWLLERMLQGRRCLGADFVELSPIDGMCGYDFAVAQYIYRFMSMVLS